MVFDQRDDGFRRTFIDYVCFGLQLILTFKYKSLGLEIRVMMSQFLLRSVKSGKVENSSTHFPPIPVFADAIFCGSSRNYIC